MQMKHIEDVTDVYSFEDYQEGAVIGLFLIVKELKTLNATLKKMEKK